jgi:succinate dehydrogenase/fumarate reductase flavoprotein subunit
MSMVCTGSAASRCFQAGAKFGNGEFIQVHPTAIPGADKLRLMSESARGEGGRVWVPRKPQDPRDPRSIPEASAITSWKSAIRSTATSCRATSPPARSSTSASTKG